MLKRGLALLLVIFLFYCEHMPSDQQNSNVDEYGDFILRAGSTKIICNVNDKRLDLKYSEITSIDEIQGLENFTNLMILLLDNNYISDISSLKNYKNLHSTLQVISVANNRLTSIPDLGMFTNLRILTLEKNLITNIDNLSSLKSIYNLHLGYNYITDISPISNIKWINYLSLSHNAITNTAILTNLTNIITIDISYNNIYTLYLPKCKPRYFARFNRISIYGRFPRRAGILAMHNFITNVVSANGYTNKVSNLDLSYNNLQDLSFLTNNIEITYSLSVDHNNITLLDEYADKVYILYARYNQITNIAGIKTNIKHLFLSHNKISDIKTLNKVSNLILLDISYNNITNINDIDLKFLEMLYIASNNISSISISNPYKLTYISFAQNPITNIYISPINCIKGVNLMECGLSNISFLTSFYYIEAIDFTSNYITDISPITNCLYLKYLSIKDNFVSNRECLSNLQYLEWRFLDRSPWPVWITRQYPIY